MLEPSAAVAVREVAAHPEWLRLEGRTVAVLGAGAEMGPLGPLLRWGATVAAVDLPTPAIWERVLGTARAAAGRLLVPVAPGTEDAGVDLLAEVPETADWLAGSGRPARGRQLPLRRRRHPRPRLRRRRRAGLPGDGGATRHRGRLPGHADRRLRGARRRGGGSRAARTTAARAPPSSSAARCAGPRGAGCCTASTRPARTRASPTAWCPQQGPNYALAKRIQRWRASVDRAAGRQVSFHVAPSTRTRSVVKNRALAAAFAGAHRFGVEVFDPATSNTLMAALLVHDLVAEPPGPRPPVAGRGVRRGARRPVAGAVRAAECARPGRGAGLRQRPRLDACTVADYWTTTLQLRRASSGSTLADVDDRARAGWRP